MSEQGNPEFKEFIVRILDASASKLSKIGQPLNAQALATVATEQLAKQLTDPEVKAAFIQAITPLVQDYLDGNLQN